MRDALYHVKAKFFKAWWVTARRKMRIRPKVGLINRVIGQVHGVAGNLSRSALRIVSFSNVFWIHELGGWVNAKGKKLPVPVTMYRVDKGGNLVARKRGRKGMRRELGAGKLTVYPTRRGTYLGKRRRGDEAPEMRYKLARSVRLTPRLGFFATWRGLQPFARNRLDVALQRAVKRFNQTRAA